MPQVLFRIPVLILLIANLAMAAAPIVVGQKLPDVTIVEKGAMVPRTKVQDGRMILDGNDLTYRPWNASEGAGRVRTIYHLAARMGVDDLNKPYIDALIAARLPEFAPDGAYKTITILNLADAFFGTRSLGQSRLEKSQREVPYAFHVLDVKGIARAAWNLQPKTSAVLVLDRDGTVLFFKEGKLSPEEIRQAVGIIKGKLSLR